MDTVPANLEGMLAMWNERDPGQIRGHVEAVLAADVIFIDPSNSIVGHDAFEAMVKEFRTKFPEAVCSRSSGVDHHHSLYRYHWEIHSGGELLLPGFDVVEMTDSGRVARVEGFFGPIPPV